MAGNDLLDWEYTPPFVLYNGGGEPMYLEDGMPQWVFDRLAYHMKSPSVSITFIPTVDTPTSSIYTECMGVGVGRDGAL